MFKVVVDPLFQIVFSKISFPTQLPDSVITHHLNIVHKENYQYFDSKFMFKPLFFLTFNLTEHFYLVQVLFYKSRKWWCLFSISDQREPVCCAIHNLCFPCCFHHRKFQYNYDRPDCRNWISPTDHRHKKYSTPLYEIDIISFLNPCPLCECINYMQNHGSLFKNNLFTHHEEVTKL